MITVLYALIKKTVKTSLRGLGSLLSLIVFVTSLYLSMVAKSDVPIIIYFFSTILLTFLAYELHYKKRGLSVRLIGLIVTILSSLLTLLILIMLPCIALAILIMAILLVVPLCYPLAVLVLVLCTLLRLWFLILKIVSTVRRFTMDILLNSPVTTLIKFLTNMKRKL